MPSQRLPDLDPDFDPRAADRTPFTRRYRELYSTMVEFLDRNDLAHRLEPVAAPAPELATIDG